MTNKEEEEDCFKLKETLQHKGVDVLVETNKGMFISGSWNDKNVKIWQTSSSSSSFNWNIWFLFLNKILCFCFYL